jgi:hypothetical protein
LSSLAIRFSLRRGAQNNGCDGHKGHDEGNCKKIHISSYLFSSKVANAKIERLRKDIKIRDFILRAFLVN